LLLAGEYDLRSEEDEGLIDEEEPALEGLLYLFCAFETLSLADTLGVVVLIPLPEGRAAPDGLAFVVTAAEVGLTLLLPATCNPPLPGLGLMPPPPG
jgi:hypothetical protein